MIKKYSNIQFESFNQASNRTDIKRGVVLEVLADGNNFSVGVNGLSSPISVNRNSIRSFTNRQNHIIYGEEHKKVDDFLNEMDILEWKYANDLEEGDCISNHLTFNWDSSSRVFGFKDDILPESIKTEIELLYAKHFYT